MTLFVSLLSAPPRRSFVTACSQTFHDVTESGTVNSIEAEPSAPVRSWGLQNAVSAKLLRIAGASPAAATAGAASPASFFLSASASSDCSCFASRRACGAGAAAGAGTASFIATLSAATAPPTIPFAAKWRPR